MDPTNIVLRARQAFSGATRVKRYGQEVPFEEMLCCLPLPVLDLIAERPIPDSAFPARPPDQTAIKWERTPACHAGNRGIQSSHADLPTIVVATVADSHTLTIDNTY